MRVVFVHGTCVRDGSWWWQRTAELLQERGVASVSPALPSCGETGVPAGSGGPGLPEDVAAVRRVLRDGIEPTVVVAHSYGGIVTAEAAESAIPMTVSRNSPATNIRVPLPRGQARLRTPSPCRGRRR